MAYYILKKIEAFLLKLLYIFTGSFLKKSPQKIDTRQLFKSQESLQLFKEDFDNLPQGYKTTKTAVLAVFVLLIIVVVSYILLKESASDFISVITQQSITTTER
jgi:hypothetical protein